MFKSILILTAFIIFSTTSSCILFAPTDVVNNLAGSSSSSTASSGSSSSGPSLPTVVYCAGVLTGGNTSCYWSNTTQVMLTNCGQVRCICVANGVVYTAGSDQSGTGHFGIWSNGAQIFSEDGDASAMQFFNGALFTAGYISVGENRTICFWSNTNRFAVSDGWYTSSLFVTPDGTVFISGEDGSNNACYWQGAGKHILADAKYINAIFVDNGIVYTAGQDTNNNSCYWSNTTEVILMTNGGGFNSMFVNNGTVYTPGQDNNNLPCYWANTNETVIFSSNVTGFASYISVKNGTVYAAGRDGNGNTCYWQGSVETVIDTNSGTWLHSFFVQ